jgi:PHD/YefM family antitoxin component YafN of YafNO toxin-antitoxin module
MRNQVCITDFKRNSATILEGLKEDRKPVVLTQYNEPCALLMDLAFFRALRAGLHIAPLLRDGEQDIEDGRYRSVRSFAREFKREQAV